MNNILIVGKYSLKESFFAYFPKKNVPGMPKNYLLRLVVLLWTYIFFGFLLNGVLKVSAEIFVKNGQDPMYFTNFAMAITTIILVLYIPQILSNFYTKSAIENYQTMPIGQGELFVGKLLGGVSSFFDFFIYLGLAIFTYFSYKGFDLGTIILGIINFFPMVLVPYTIMALIILLIKKFTNVNSHQKLVKTLGYVLMFALIGIIYYFSFRGSLSGDSSINESRLVEGFSGISNFFINAKIFGLALGGSLSQRIIFTGINLVISLILLVISKRLGESFYYQAVFDEKKDTSKTNKKTKKVGLKESSQFMAIFKKDLRTLFSNIVFLSSPITIAMMFVIITVTTGKQIIKDVDDYILSDPLAMAIIFFIGFAIGLFVWLNGGVANTSLSREGKSFYMIQTMPIDPLKHMLARYSSALLISTLINIVISLLLGFILKIGFLNTCLFFLGLSLSTGIATMVSLYFGTFMVNTTWKKPSEIMQGNFKAVGFYLGSIVFLMVLGAIFGGLLAVANDNLIIPSLVIFFIVLIGFVLVTWACYKRYKKGFMDLE